jgi:hypothetical protein
VSVGPTKESRLEMGCALAWCLCLVLIRLSAGATAGPSRAADCDTVPTGVETQDSRLYFEVPPRLMPDPQFDGRPASLEVHRVRPVYAVKCQDVPSRAAVFIHGRIVTGPVAFDLRYPAPGGGTLSVQEALAWAGIDTFAPSLLGYGRSTTFQTGLDDPGNASLRPYATTEPARTRRDATAPTIPCSRWTNRDPIPS